MIFIGVAGPSGSGKTTICNIFRDNGYKVFELDKIAKHFYPQAAPKVKEEFGPEAIKNDGTIDTKALGRIVFADRDKMDQLNKIMFPLIFDGFFGPLCSEAGHSTMQGDGEILVFDAPMLYETNSWWIAMDYVLFIDADLEVRIKRLVEGRKIPREIAEIQAKIFNYDKVQLRKQDIKIDNSTDSTKIIQKLKIWLQEIKKPEYDEDSNERYTGWSNLAI